MSLDAMKEITTRLENELYEVIELKAGGNYTKERSRETINLLNKALDVINQDLIEMNERLGKKYV